MRVHVLHLRVGDERYALPSARVVEVVPSVALRQVPGTPPEVAGLLAYRGRIVPVVDLAARFARPSPKPAFSTRIAVCHRGPLGGATPGPAAAEPSSLLGILAADVTRVGVLDPDAPGSHPGPRPDDIPALGRVTADEEGLVQLVDLDQLLPAALLARLDGIPAGEAP